MFFSSKSIIDNGIKGTQPSNTATLQSKNTDTKNNIIGAIKNRKTEE